jgi:hypothetical protein
MPFCSCPFVRDASGIGAIAAAELQRLTVELLEGALGEESDGLAAPLRESARGGLGWTPSLRFALTGRRPAAPVAAAAEHVLGTAKSLRPFECTLELAEPARIRADPVILEPARAVRIAWRPPRLEIETGGTAVTVTSGAARAERLHRDAGWIDDAGGAGIVRDRHGGCFRDLAAAIPVAADGVLHAEVTQARRLLRRVAPAYAVWSEAVVRYVLPVEAREGQFASASARTAPGVVALSPGAGAVRVAESLVHEASHQYLFFAGRFARLVAARSVRLYYSPFVGRDRPLDKILLAFHAAANVVAFYWLLRDSEEWEPALAADLERVLDDCRVLDGHLLGNADVTAAGRAIHLPVREWLAERGLPGLQP